MKYIILLGDGMPDHPLEELDEKTPLEAASTPNMDRMAREGSVGAAHTVPEQFLPGSDVTNLGIMGYDPDKYYTGRAPFEAASMGVALEKEDIAFRCNLVTLKPIMSGLLMEDFSAGHISTPDAVQLIRDLNDHIQNDALTFYPGISYRHLLVWKGGPLDLELTPPHDISDQTISTYMPKGEKADELIKIMSDAQIFLASHEINKAKKSSGTRQANSIWLWGHGKAPSMPSFQEIRGLKGSLVAAVDLMKGIGKCAGLNVVDVPGATGYLDTNFEGKAEYALKELETSDFVYLHVEAPDEAGHNGSATEKVKAIEDFDAKVVGKVLEGIKKFQEYRILLVSDHRTPVAIKTHSREEVPFALYPSIGKASAPQGFSEKIVETSTFKVKNGYELMDLLLD